LTHDVIVVGGGIIGCAVADILSSRGASVHVIDPRPLGGGATQASGGMLAPYAEGAHAPALEALGARSLALHAALAARLGPEVPFLAAGSLHVAFDDAETSGLEALAEGHRRRGIESLMLTGAQARELEPGLSAGCACALLIPSHALVGALALARHAWTAASSRGGRWTTGRVTRIHSCGGAGLRVESSAGPLSAGRVVLAAGSWAPQVTIDGVAPLPVRPLRGQLLHLRMSPATDATSWGGASRIVWASGCYLVPWPDGSMLVGATTEDVGYDERATAAAVRDLLGAAAEVLPSAWHAEFLGVRVGLRPASPDELPIIGASSRVPGLVYATGHHRNGVLLAPLTAELVAKAIAGEDDPAFSVTSADRFGDF
jgi:glycine oxidase